MKKIFTVLSLAFIFCLFNPIRAGAVGIGVKPKSLNINAGSGGEVNTEMLVMNTGREPAMYKIFPDGLENKIKISPSDFRLEPDGTQIVKVSVKIIAPGKYASNLSVMAKPLSTEGFSASTGVKIPIEINVFGYMGMTIIAAVCLLAAIMIIFKKNIINSNLCNKKQN